MITGKFLVKDKRQGNVKGLYTELVMMAPPASMVTKPSEHI